ncbi:hypothetical protein KDA_75380 [Dictyobacter alpinus]|uniref:Uncharacterized protein n=1 Tax=Dictyobacter alpinus TaxID=2014873 RepID=A0A402BL31_9CHLR|nr:hypothetical protein KDA_75380 [Dictyobacter alpinus]
MLPYAEDLAEQSAAYLEYKDEYTQEQPGEDEEDDAHKGDKDENYSDNNDQNTEHCEGRDKENELHDDRDEMGWFLGASCRKYACHVKPPDMGIPHGVYYTHVGELTCCALSRGGPNSARAHDTLFTLLV